MNEQAIIQELMRGQQENQAAMAQLREQLENRDRQLNQAMDALNRATMAANAAATAGQGQPTSANAQPVINVAAQTAAKCNKPKVYKGDRAVMPIKNFLYSMNTYIRETNVPPAKQVDVATTYLEDDALTWWISHSSKFTDADKAHWTIETVLTAIEREFMPRMAASDARNKLKQIKMKREQYKDYYDEFSKLLVSAGNVAEREKVDWFMAGLTKHYVDSLPGLTRVPQDQLTYEQLVDACEVLASYGKNGTQSSPAGNTTEPMDLSGAEMKKKAFAKQHQQQQQLQQQQQKQKQSKHPRLSADQKAKLRAEGKCFICTKEGHVSRDCPQHIKNGGKQGFPKQ